MQDDPSELDSIFNRYVIPCGVPVYLSLLHGNLMSHEAKQAVGLPQLIAASAKEITDVQLTRLLVEREWRGRLTAAWYIALTRRANFVERITASLLASEQCFAGQGYCLALGLIGGKQCEEGLRAYLTKYLPPRLLYDQQWAIGALAHVNCAPPSEFLEPSLWKMDKGEMDPARGIKFFADLVTYLMTYGLVADQPGSGNQSGL